MEYCLKCYLKLQKNEQIFKKYQSIGKYYIKYNTDILE